MIFVAVAAAAAAIVLLPTLTTAVTPVSPRAAKAAITKPASAPATTSAPAAPIQMAGRATVYPPRELVDRCKRAADDFAPRLDKTFHSVVSPPFVVFSNGEPAETSRQIEGCITRPADAMWRGYFEKKPDEPIVVLLFKDDKTYRHWSKELFGDGDISHFGYYKPDKRTMVMNISTGGGTLIHELTHALIVYDFPGVPRWFNEALGSLHEGCRVGEDDIIGMVNWRLPGLKDAIKNGSRPSLREMVTGEFTGSKQAVNYATARYFAMYMQKQGLLKKFYRYYRDHRDAEHAAVKAIEHVFGKKIEEVDADFLEYAKGLK